MGAKGNARTNLISPVGHSQAKLGDDFHLNLMEYNMKSDSNFHATSGLLQSHMLLDSSPMKEWVCSKNLGDTKFHLPGKHRFKPASNVTRIFNTNKDLLKMHGTKSWLKRKSKHDSLREQEKGSDPNKGEGNTVNRIKQDYLMSTREIKQNGIIEALFKNFDADGSGSLDVHELVDLFKENKIRLDKDTIRQMFQGDEFTLTKFKAINNSPEGLQMFKDCLRPQLKRIVSEITSEYGELMSKARGHQERKMEGNSESSDFENHIVQVDGAKPIYVPKTFESLMEIFGINLQRKTLYASFLEKYKEINQMTKSKDAGKEEILKASDETFDIMIELMSLGNQTQTSIINDHNQLFMRLVENIRVKKQ